MTTVTFDHLTKTYPGRQTPVLNAFSLEVHSGELVALLGPSGIGKSTLLKLFAGLESPDAGDILMDGRSILAIPANRRGAVLMFQRAYLFPFLTVGENIAFGLKVQRISRQERQRRVAEMLHLIGLPGIEKRKPQELSGGEQQRVALARALVVRPKVLLLDEPFSSLDTPVRRELQEAVRDIQRELGITTILVTHDLDEAMAMSDRMALLMDGRVAACDRPNVLFQRPPCVATAKFLGVTIFVHGEATNGWLASPEFGRIRLVNAEISGRAIFAIRPEHIRLRSEACENAVRGVVGACMYRGEHMEVKVNVGGMQVRAQLPGSEKPVPEGASVFVQLPPEHLFPVGVGNP